MEYHKNVQALCDEHHVSNPIQEDILTIAKLTFKKWTVGDSSATLCEVEATDLNRAGRLFLQVNANGLSNVWLGRIRGKALKFFTMELWADCSLEKRTLVYGIRTAERVEITYK